VPQDAPLVTGTLLDNVGLAAASEQASRDAVELVGASGLAARLGNDRIGPAGRPLSGGERRLVSLARAVATGLPVLVLDEPTEGLDPSATRQVLSAIRRLRGSRTVIVSSHRAEVAQAVGHIVDLADAPPIAAQ
jgi:ABC-type transport system involved in cytochrome bd biosynthesis fused ATPase/permease subunit